MAEEDDFASYKDISELKRELEGMKGRKDISTKELYDAVQKLAQTVTDMLDIFSAATEQMKLEDKEYESDARKHEMTISKLDKLIDQNKTIAEGMVAIVEMVKKNFVEPAKEKEDILKPKEEPMFMPKPEPRHFMKPQQEWQPKPQEPMMQKPHPAMPPPQFAPPIMANPITAPMPPQSFSDFNMPPMMPEPSPELQDLDMLEDSLEEQGPKKKGLFGMFKK